MRSFLTTIFRIFLTGLAALMPLVVTILVAGWIVRLADSYIGPSSNFGKFLVNIIGPTDPFPGYVVGYVVVAMLIFVLGFLVTRATVSRVHKAIDDMFAGIPLVGKIYKAVGQAVDLLRGADKKGLERFGGVVQINLGSAKMVALLTSHERYTLADGREHILVFIPNSPIPMTGFNVLVPADEVQHLDMSVEDLAKLFMSLGILGPQVLPKPLAKLSMKVNPHGVELTG
jgi:uncharacterized membrane protein